MNRQLLITGAQGQLGLELQLAMQGREDWTVLCTDVAQLDITDEAAIEAYFAAHAIDMVVNCAAYTAVDRAEDDEANARRINAMAPALLATACKRHGARLVHVSTDYVFDGDKNTPYREDDTPHPVTAYGRTKLEGERRVLEILPHDSVIVRTAWLYSPHGKNFVKTMLQLGRTKDALRVVVDQVGSPTSATDLAGAIVTIIDAPQWVPGIYHFTDEGAISWYDFTMAIHRLAGITACAVSPCLSSEYPTPAHRPPYSVLDKSRIKHTYGIHIPHWEASLRLCLERMNETL